MKPREAIKPVVLIIADGWGLSQDTVGNALKCVPTPNLDWLQSNFPSATLGCSGLDVGLRPGQMGDSNVGHLNIGAGRIVYQDMVRISKAMESGELSQNTVWKGILVRVQGEGSRLHLFGLLSDGGVHSHIEHLKALLEDCRRAGVNPYLHLQLDGRDVAPTSGVDFLLELQSFIADRGVGILSTVMGRYYGMDRDQRWERTEKAYLAMVAGQGRGVTDVISAVRESYAKGVTDEFVEPLVVMTAQPEARVRDRDEVLLFNFRAERVRQITQALWHGGEVGFPVEIRPLVSVSTLTVYHRSFPLPFLFAPQDFRNTLGEVISRQGLKQLRLAETEKYAHVTFFFNGGIDTPFPAEDRVLIPSPKVRTYDLQPEMSAVELTQTFVSKLSEGYDFIVVNYANLDMVGHTGVFSAACHAVETVDDCVGRAVKAVLGMGGAVLITSDHGNAEHMLDAEGGVYTAHTLNKVPLILASQDTSLHLQRSGILADIAPTVLALMGLPQPGEMTGRSLIEGGEPQ